MCESGAVLACVLAAHFIPLTAVFMALQFATSLDGRASNAPPIVVITFPTNLTELPLGSNVLLQATATDSDGWVTKVEFFSGTVRLGETTNAPFEFTWTNVAMQATRLFANATDNGGAIATSGPVVVMITNRPNPALRHIGNVFVIAVENHNFTQPPSVSFPLPVLSNSAAPYLNSLVTPGHSNAAQVSFAKRYHQVGAGVHPSEANYIWIEAGSDFGIHTSADPTLASQNVFNAPHLTRSLNAGGIPWRNYQEDVQFSRSPTNSAAGTNSSYLNPFYHTGQYYYAVKHNPMAFFTDTQTQNVRTFAELFSDLTNNTVGRYNWITPNQYNDQHSGLTDGFTYHGVIYTNDQAAIAQSDHFLSILIPQVMASPAYQTNGVILLWWDETVGGDSAAFTMPFFVISPLARGNAYASEVELNHSSALKTMLGIFDLPFWKNSIPLAETAAAGGYNYPATVNDLSDMFRELNRPPTARDATLVRAAGLPLKIDIQQLLAAFTSDPDGDPRALVSVGGCAAGNLSTNAVQITYAPTNDVPDAFAYVVSDGLGGSATATIVMDPVPHGGLARAVQLSNNVLTVEFAAASDFQYDVQRSTNLVDWDWMQTVSPPLEGAFPFCETNPPTPAFYRLLGRGF